MSTVLFLDPLHEYANRFVEVFAERFGVRSIAAFTKARKEQFYRRNECLPSDAFASRHQFDGDLDAFAQMLRRTHPDLVAVIPFSEEVLEPSCALMNRLGIRWNAPEVMARFRDKGALKAHLRCHAPSIRLNFSHAVRSGADLDALGARLPKKFVLKPNSGFGSKGVGVFAASELSRAKALLDASQDDYLLEEFVEGTLYTVDGLVDEDAAVHVAAVFSSGRRALNGSAVVYGDGFLVHQDTPLFASLRSYARDVMRASGLRRSPFHMEVMVDARGPCLIEVGARLIGHSHAFTCERVHGGSFDFFGASALGYLGRSMNVRVAFDHYDRIQAAKLYGASEREETLYSVSGVQEVEQLPAFDRWIVKPQVGAALHRTTDLFTVPYSAVLVSPREGASITELAALAHATLRFNADADPLARLRVDGERVASKLRQKLEWLTERTFGNAG